MRLVSSDKNVIEIWSSGEKLIAGLLIDLVTNPHNSSHIEYLGFAKDQKIAFDTLRLMFQNFENQVVTRNVHSGIVACHHPSLPFPEKHITDMGYELFYETYELELKEVINTNVKLGASQTFLNLDLSSFDEYFEVLKQSFSQNPDTSVGTYDDVKAGFVNAEIPTYIVRDSGNIIGFINLFHDNKSKIGDVNTIGVLPEWRGQGVGKYLLNFGVQHLKTLGAQSINLSVAVLNEKALKLYFNTGFKLLDKYSVFRKDLSKKVKS